MGGPIGMNVGDEWEASVDFLKKCSFVAFSETLPNLCQFECQK